MIDIVERLRSGGVSIATLLKAADEIERLRTELAAAQKDAERYRYLRWRGHTQGLNIGFTYALLDPQGPYKSRTPEEIDGLIDRAIDQAVQENKA